MNISGWTLSRDNLMIKVKNLFYKYEKHEAAVISDITMAIKEGEYVAIIGPNGCG